MHVCMRSFPQMSERIKIDGSGSLHPVTSPPRVCCYGVVPDRVGAVPKRVGVVPVLMRYYSRTRASREPGGVLRAPSVTWFAVL